jgi:predicted DNA-binding transcriptional regulator AlpA
MLTDAEPSIQLVSRQPAMPNGQVPKLRAAESTLDPAETTGEPQIEQTGSLNKAGPPSPAVPPLFWSSQQFAKALGISLATFHRHQAANRIGPKPVRLGGRVLYPAKECLAWAESRMPDGRLPNRREWEAIHASKKRE